ncbi:MAG TPA: hypothetical protein VIB39_16480 [Candidatus Angelobacter sp.]|jgi:surface polysaccharide O-acyltransferase-like enzyme
MSQPGQSNGLRSFGAVLAGVVAIFILSIATDVVFHAVGVFPPLGQPFSDKLCLLATAYRIVYGVAGGAITARLAPGKPMQHALALGLVGVVLASVGAIATWNRGPAFGPHWYPVTLIVISVPCAWLGGKLVRNHAAAAR